MYFISYTQHSLWAKFPGPNYDIWFDISLLISVNTCIHVHIIWYQKNNLIIFELFHAFSYYPAIYWSFFKLLFDYQDANEELQRLRQQVVKYRMELTNRENNFNRVFQEQKPVLIGRRQSRGTASLSRDTESLSSASSWVEEIGSMRLNREKTVAAGGEIISPGITGMDSRDALVCSLVVKVLVWCFRLYWS